MTPYQRRQGRPLHRALNRGSALGDIARGENAGTTGVAKHRKVMPVSERVTVIVRHRLTLRNGKVRLNLPVISNWESVPLQWRKNPVLRARAGQRIWLQMVDYGLALTVKPLGPRPGKGRFSTRWRQYRAAWRFHQRRQTSPMHFILRQPRLDATPKSLP